MSDPIERQEAIDALKEAYWEFANDDQDMVDAIIDWAIRKIEGLSSAQRTGRWIKNDNGTYSCDQCHSWIPNEQHYYARYCIFCGAKMEGEEE